MWQSIDAQNAHKNTPNKHCNNLLFIFCNFPIHLSLPQTNTVKAVLCILFNFFLAAKRTFFYFYCPKNIIDEIWYGRNQMDIQMLFIYKSHANIIAFCWCYFWMFCVRFCNHVGSSRTGPKSEIWTNMTNRKIWPKFVCAASIPFLTICLLIHFHWK